MRRMTGVLLGCIALLGFGLVPVLAVDASIHLHENPEGIIGPMWIGLISLFFSLLAWRISSSKRYAMLAAVGTPVSILVAAVSMRLFGR